MPADITGSSVLNMTTSEFHLHQGPIFTDLLLVDEINRMPPRTQAALLEAMEERQVTIDGVPRALSPLFTVVATQNPVEFEGTYPLPEAELDRFAVKIKIGYPDAQDEEAILARHREGIPSSPRWKSIAARSVPTISRRRVPRPRASGSSRPCSATSRRSRGGRVNGRRLRSAPVHARRFT